MHLMRFSMCISCVFEMHFLCFSNALHVFFKCIARVFQMHHTCFSNALFVFFSWYNIGQLSVQRAASWVLERYYQDFPVYNPYLDRVPSRKKGHNNSSFKYYDVDGSNAGSEVRMSYNCK